MYTSGQVAKMMGVTLRTLDHYRYEKLIHPTAVKKGENSEWFMYDESDIEDLYLIRLCRAADMKLSEIAKILKEDKSFKEKLAAQIDVLENKRDRLNRQIKFAKQVQIVGSDALVGARIDDETVNAMAKAYDSFRKEMRRYLKTFDKERRIEIERALASAYERLAEAMGVHEGFDFEELHSAAKDLLLVFTVVEQRPVNIMELPFKHLLLLSDDSEITLSMEEILGEEAREDIVISLATVYAYYALPRLSVLSSFDKGNKAEIYVDLEEVFRLSLGPTLDIGELLDKEAFDLFWLLIEMTNELAEDIVEIAPDLEGYEKLSSEELNKIKGEFLTYLKEKHQDKED